MAEILSVSNLSVTFTATDSHQSVAVNKISFSIQEGRITAIVGQSGSGKSTLALAIARLLSNNVKISGKINFNDIDLLKLGNKELCKIRGKQIGMIFQDPLTCLNPLHHIKNEISEAIKVHNKNISAASLKKRINELLELAELKNFTSRLNSYPHQLSGGQKQRVMIAIALANNPQILIADEPTTALDDKTSEQILKLLLNLRKKLKLTILFITHDLKVVKKLADEVLVMHQGKIIEEQSVEDIFQHPQHDYTKLLIAALKFDYRQKNNKKGDKILQINNLSVKFPIKKSFLGFGAKYLYANDNISFDLNLGDNLGIVGSSGSGKSTLALAISRLIKSEGQIIFNNQNIKELNKVQQKQIRSQIQIIFQDPYNSLNPRMTIEEIIGEGLIIHNIAKDSKQRSEMVDAILKEVGLNPQVKKRYPHQFSGGQRQRIAIARSLILKPKLLILDEPTSALDLLTQKEILKLLKNLQTKHQISYILISHDLDVVKSISDRIARFENGKIVKITANKNSTK